jgi:DNA-binding transcriptional ArsR family regulator
VKPLAPLLAILLALPFAQAAQVSGTQVSFQSPAQFGGAIDASLGWVLLLMHGHPAAFDLQAQGAASLVNHSTFYSSIEPKWPDPDMYPGEVLPDHPDTLPDDLHAGVAFQGQSWSTVYIRAERIRFAVGAGNGTLRLLPTPATSDYALASLGQRPEVSRPPGQGVPTDQPLLSLQNATGAVFQLEASGVRDVEWHGAAVSCPSQGACPDGGGTFERNWTSPRGDFVSNRIQYYTEVGMANGTLRGQGVLVAATGGARQPTLAVTGWMRLPLAELQGTCQDCVQLANRTLRVDGSIQLSNVAPSQHGRFTANLGGDVTMAHLDESRIAPTLLFGGSTAVVAAGLAVVGWLLVKFFPALFTRVLGDPLKHPTRRKVYDAVCKDPGANYRAIMAATGLSDGVVRLHLARLEAAGLLVSRRQGKSRLYFENHGRYDANWPSVGALRDPDLRELAQLVAAKPNSSQQELLDAAHAQWGWTRRRTQVRLHRLVRWGLVGMKVDGRLRRYALTGPT